MFGKLLSALTVSFAALAPMQLASAQKAPAMDTLAEAAIYAQTDNWHKVVIEPGTTYFYLTGYGEGEELDLFVYNQAGKLIASDETPGDQAEVRIVSRQRAVVGIEVRNVGKLDSKYILEMETQPLRR